MEEQGNDCRENGCSCEEDQVETGFCQPATEGNNSGNNAADHLNQQQPVGTTGQVGQQPQPVGTTGQVGQQPQPVGTTGQVGQQPQPVGTTGQVGQQPQPVGTTGQVGQQPQPVGTTGQVGQQPQPVGTTGQVGQQPQHAAGYPDPAAYAAWQQAVWQQAVWQQQMAAQQAGQGYPYPHSVPPVPPYAAATPAGGHDHETSSHHPKHDAHKYGQLIQMAEKFVNGETNIDDLINGLSGLDYQSSQFWRGILIGAGASLLFSSDMFSNGLAKLFKRSETDTDHNNSQQQKKE